MRITLPDGFVVLILLAKTPDHSVSGRVRSRIGTGKLSKIFSLLRDQHVAPNSGAVYADKGYCDKDAKQDALIKNLHLCAIKKNNMKGKNHLHTGDYLQLQKIGGSDCHINSSGNHHMNKQIAEPKTPENNQTPPKLRIKTQEKSKKF